MSSKQVRIGNHENKLPTYKHPKPTYFDDVEWNDVTIVGDQLTHVKGVPASTLRAKEIKSVCTKLNVKGLQNKAKDKMIQRLIQVYHNRQQYDKMQSGGRAATRKEPQCALQLMNIMFSDEFAEQFVVLGNVANINSC